MDTKQAQNETSAKIAKLNDRFRGMCLDVFYTKGVRDGIMDLIGLSRAVEDFSSFTEDNDPYGEHDFGSLSVQGEKIFWKIEYFDEALSKWCDPLDGRCRRHLTIMLAEEY